MTRLPRERFQELRDFFPTQDEQKAFNLAWKESLKVELGEIDPQPELDELRGQGPVLKNISLGRNLPDEHSLPPPQPAFNPNFLNELEPPSGAVKPHDRFYIERNPDQRIKLEIVKSGITLSIRAPRQTGKTSLLMRGLQHARDQKLKIVFHDLQEVDHIYLASLEKLLFYLAQVVVSELQFDLTEMHQSWQSSPLPSSFKLTNLLKGILDKLDTPVILALDEADRLLQTDFHSGFFALIRSWHNKRAYSEQWNKLNLVLVIATEPHLFIADASQSPFNVGLELVLEDFTATQVRDLNQRHGSPVQESDLPQLMGLLNGHPYLTRQALYTMVVTQGLTWEELHRQAFDEKGPFGQHLRHQYRLLRDEPVLKEALKQVIRQKNCADDRALYRLLKAGLIKGSGEEYTCRCGLYERYFKDKFNL
ncbi:MAG: AAA-like domain-containing protein [Chloroflexi bacterium]|nr:AAA-like domain-containing protein [Chloroflexota bacterium]